MSQSELTETQKPETEIGAWLSTFPDPILRQVVQDIHLAHQANPKSWAVTRPQGNSLCFYVGDILVLGISSRESGLFLDANPDDPEFDDMKHVGRIVTHFKSARGFRFWTKDIDALISMLERHRTEHQAAIPTLAKAVVTKSNRGNEHQDEIVECIANMVGSDVVQPDYPRKGNQSTPASIEAPLPDTAGPSGDVADPTPEAARQMALTILAAHDISPDSWAVYASNHRMVVMVGNVAAGGSRQAGKYDTVMVRDALDSETAEKLAATPVPKIPKGYETLIFPQVADTTPESEFLSWRQAHEAALAVVTDPYKKAVLWQSHRDDLTRRIAAIADVELPQPGYISQIPSQPKPGIRVAPVSLVTVRDRFAATGLTYTWGQVATFVTALQTKGFVVLSGISGTGKSKIATGFVDMLPFGSGAVSVITTPEDQPDLIPVRVKLSTKSYGLINLPIKQMRLFPVPEARTTIDVLVRFQGIEQRCSFRHIVAPSSIYRLSFSGELRKRIVALPEGEILYCRIGVDETNSKITTIDIELQREIDQSGNDGYAVTPAPNHLFLSVRPDWRDSTSLLGYYNPLTQTYEWTEFLRFIIRAGENYRGPVAERIAWFVILDEMNLAHVEYYFADLLSVLESGRNEEGWTQQPLRTSYPDTIGDDDVPDREIPLPPNLYIIGTVNMDETTHAFSPKVLDRAFTIELTDVDFTSYPPSPQESQAAGLDALERKSLLAAFSRDGRFHLIDKHEIAETVARHPEIRRHLQTLNHLLQRDRFHFGYRVFDEIAQYLAVNDETLLMPFEEAFDWAVFMKVLPKFSGSLARLRSPLTSVLAWAIDPEHPDIDSASALAFPKFASAGSALDDPVAGAAYPNVARRAVQMLATLRTDGFVSFG